MNLKVLLPFQIFVQQNEVSRIIAETREGSFGLLPHRLDCVAALVPGLLIYESHGAETSYIAVDEGVLVKSGPEVLISVRRAIRGMNLRELHEAVKREFLLLEQREKEVRVALSKMQAAFVGRFAEYKHERRG
jgi:F-type H+-transporting ATPase subunit epsilon